MFIQSQIYIAGYIPERAFESISGIIFDRMGIPIFSVKVHVSPM